ncbi:TetR/AcrR family transcriptional regulator [Nocardioides silvaticus]|uniref:TetR/AcrR family transcriptional regulator n=1 Tax=Nocardioides silvaticus TaxID=2201891 RepID=A0A316TKQ5_9ACTN|nr:TetR/AcrR family transcriptional regulator [Nocardioides silvaticus]PWN04358.1 TetR/AcrR family transcriptional regulator [Nocardioides silvaticus]
MPKLWNETIESHRNAVREAILETTWRLVNERGLLSVTMTQVAEGVGIGRATLYKYFPDVESILRAHHQRHVDQHLEELTKFAGSSGPADERLHAALSHYALICHYRARHGSADLSALLHRSADVADAEERIHGLFTQLLDEVSASGGVRTDIAASELADYCLHALGAAAKAPDEAATSRLVELCLRSLQSD